MNTQSISQKLIGVCLMSLSVASVSAGDFQQNVLLNPGKHVLMAEAQGRVMIYDGLANSTVEKVMDDQFDRIGSMMFVRTRYVQENGQVVEDEDCDD